MLINRKAAPLVICAHVYFSNFFVMAFVQSSFYTSDNQYVIAGKAAAPQRLSAMR